MAKTVEHPMRQSISYGPVMSANEELDLIELIAVLLRRKWWLLLMTFLGGTITYGVTKLMPNQYESYVRTNLMQQADPGGVSPDNRRAPEVLTLVEHGFVLGTTTDNYRDVIMAQLRSRKFTLGFIERYKIAQYLFPEAWDKYANQWIGNKPDSRKLYVLFHESIRFVDHNPETDIISIRIRFSDPDLSAQWANNYVAEFNSYMKKRALQEVERKQVFLNQQLQETDMVELHKSIYRLIEAQTAVSMLASSTDEYVLQVLDPAYSPLERFSPARKRVTILGAAGGFSIAFFLIIASVPVKRLKESLREYRLGEASQLG
jgi:capsular polysaccharide biosynthesis protein